MYGHVAVARQSAGVGAGELRRAGAKASCCAVARQSAGVVGCRRLGNRSNRQATLATLPSRGNQLASVSESFKGLAPMQAAVPSRGNHRRWKRLHHCCQYAASSRWGGTCPTATPKFRATYARWGFSRPDTRRAAAATAALLPPLPTLLASAGSAAPPRAGAGAASSAPPY
jgi:hypothetical protein